MDIKIPYDIYKQFTIVTLGLDTVFPRLDTATIRASRNIDFEMISGLKVTNTYQLYRSYLDNFRINARR